MRIKQSVCPPVQRGGIGLILKIMRLDHSHKETANYKFNKSLLLSIMFYAFTKYDKLK